MKILLLRGFNNYFNRIVKKYSTLEDYKENSDSYVEFTDINFNPNDGVTTELIIGNNVQLENGEPLKWEFLGTPDYLVCYETDEGSDSSDDSDDIDIIKFRWFVLESERTRNGQYRLALKRDVLADNFEAVLSAPCFVEKGFVASSDDPLLVNTEGSIVNQIKKSEVPLVDETNCAWLVGYLKKNDAGKSTSGVMSKDFTNIYSYDSLSFKDCISFDDGTQSTKTLIQELGSSCLNIFYTIRGEQWPVDHYYDYRGSLVWGQWFRIEYQGSQGNPGYGSLTTHLIYANNNDSGPTTNWAPWMESATGGGVIPEGITVNFLNYLKSAGKNAANLVEAYELSSGTTAAQLRGQYNGAIITKGGKYYQLMFYSSSSIWSNNTYNAGSSAAIGAYMSYVVNALNSKASGRTAFSFNSATAGNSLGASLNYVPIEIYAVEIANVSDSISINIPSVESRITCEDAQYDIFAVPFIPRQYRDIYDGMFKYNNITRYVDSDACLFIVQKLMTELGIQSAGGAGARAYDLQLLPYCPIKFDPRWGLDQLDSKSFTIITKTVNDTNIPIGYVLFPSSSNFTVDLPITKKITSDEKRVQNHLGDGDAVLDTDNTTYKIETSLTPIPHPVLGFKKDTFKSVESYEVYINGQLDSGAILKVGDYIRSIGSSDYYAFKISNITSIDSPQEVNYELKLNVIFKGSARPLDIKISNECDFLRLTAPNFNSLFEFKLSKMAESQIHYINVDCTYRPINPYIKLNPDFSGLYGQDFDDSTGLLFNGDFSLATLSDAWVNYEHSNKNYQVIFNRQIQSLDTTQQLERDQMAFQNVVGAITGPFTGAAGGALAGAKLGGGYGAAAGAAIGFVGGTALSIAGGVKNNEWLARQQSEAKSYTIDMYNYQLGNIKALPQSLTKGDPITYNNKVWPILEEFSCTDAEKEIIKNKIRYNGMTIMAVGKLEDYSRSVEFEDVYVKGQLIRLTDIKDDFHVIDAIYQEVDKGFYIPQQGE